jgi:hypothetical protein
VQAAVGGGGGANASASASASGSGSGRVRRARIRYGVLVLEGVAEGGGARGCVVCGRGEAPLRFVGSLVVLRGG